MSSAAQEVDRVEISAPREAVWDLLVDSARLSEWLPVVRGTTGHRERLDSTRIVEVQLGRRKGRVGDRCVIFEPLERIGWRMERDSFGVWRQIDLGVEFSLQDTGDGGTAVVHSTWSRPRTVLGKAISRLIVRRRLRSLRQTALANLRRIAEQESPRHLAARRTALPA